MKGNALAYQESNLENDTSTEKLDNKSVQNNTNLIETIKSDINSIFSKEYCDNNDSALVLAETKKYIYSFYKKFKTNDNYLILESTAIDLISSLAKDNGIPGLSKSTLKKSFTEAKVIKFNKNIEEKSNNKKNKSSLSVIFERLYLTNNEVEHIQVTRSYIESFVKTNYPKTRENNSGDLIANYNDLKEIAISRIREVTVNRRMVALKESKIKAIFTEIENRERLLQIEAKPVEVVDPNGNKSSFIDLPLDPLACFSINKNQEIEITRQGTELISNCIIENLGIASGSKSIETFIPSLGIWAITNPTYLDSIINKILISKTKSYFTNKQINEVSKRLMINSFDVNFGKNTFNTEPFRLTFKNGTYDMKEKKFYNEFFKEDRSTVRVNWNYVDEYKNQRPEKLDKFLSMMVDEETIELIYETIGSFFAKEYLPKRFIILYGGGNNGKSTLLDLFKAILGAENVSSVNLQGLTDANFKFQRVMLMDKLANIVGEIPADYVLDTSLLKMFTGQKDNITAEKKGQDPIEFKNFANIIFACNKLPKFNDHTEGLQSRLLIIPMQKNFKELVTNPSINTENIHIDDITKDKELIENIISYSIQRFINTNFGKNMTEPQSVKESLNNYLDQDLLRAFVNEEYVFTDNEKDRITCKEILERFNKFKEDEDDGLNTSYTASGIGKAIEERFSSKVKYLIQGQVNGCKKRNIITNLKYKEQFTEIEMQENIF